jgi:hypothetical protein
LKRRGLVSDRDNFGQGQHLINQRSDRFRGLHQFFRDDGGHYKLKELRPSTLEESSARLAEFRIEHSAKSDVSAYV